MNNHKVVRYLNLCWHYDNTERDNPVRPIMIKKIGQLYNLLTGEERTKVHNTYEKYMCNGCDLCKELGIEHNE